MVDLIRRYSNLGQQKQRWIEILNAPRTGQIVPPKPKQIQRRLAPDEIFDLVHAYEDGTKINDLAKQFGVSRTTVIGHMKREGIKSRYKKLDGKLEEIKELRAAGWSYARLGKHFGVDAGTVRRMLLNI